MMAHCIFCGTETQYEIAGGKTVCVQCYIRLKKIEVEHLKEITQEIMGEASFQQLQKRFMEMPSETRDKMGSTYDLLKKKMFKGKEERENKEDV